MVFESIEQRHFYFALGLIYPQAYEMSHNRYFSSPVYFKIFARFRVLRSMY